MFQGQFARVRGRAKQKHGERGQASVLIGMMMATFLLFFAFVVNTGMLVNAKINLQNAADLAAYAGAAVQARQLDDIAYLNYEMRRQYKKFLFRYYVVGNMAQRSHPGFGGGGTGARLWSPDGTTNYGVPTTCVIFNRMDNFCQLAALRGIPDVGAGSGQIFGTLRQQLQGLERVRQQNCLVIGRTNRALLTLWLYNTDPDLQRLEQEITAANSELAGVVPVIRGLAAGLGLVPREELLYRRLRTLEEYVNQSPAQGVSPDVLKRLQQSEDPATHERTIQAYLSAYNTLGGCDEADGCTFDNSGEIVMNEILPGGNAGANLLRLLPVQTEFDTYRTEFTLKNATGNPPAENERADCNSFLTPLRVNNVKLGVYKDPSVLTYYAISLTARAKVMFSPFGDMTLKAFAAAQPFGSRIGPPISGVAAANSNLRAAKVYDPACGLGANFLFGCSRFIPNLPVRAQDNTDGGWLMNDVIAATAGFLNFGQGGPQSNAIGPEQLERAYRAAMAPNPWERGRYQIPNDQPDASFGREFATEGDYPGTHAIWAPIISPGKPQSGNELQSLIEEMVNAMTLTNADDPGTQAPELAVLKESLKRGMAEYVSKLRQNQGEGGESYHYARINDPFLLPPTPGRPGEPINLPAELMMRDPKDLRTSWNQVGDTKLRQAGRTGYSVKLVAFKSLLQPQGVSTDAQGTVWVNPPPIARELPDSSALQH